MVPNESDLGQLLLAVCKINQSGLVDYAVDTGTVANTYSATYKPALLALADGLVLRFKAARTNTGASTFAPNGLPGKPIVGVDHDAIQGSEIMLSTLQRHLVEHIPIRSVQRRLLMGRMCIPSVVPLQVQANIPIPLREHKIMMWAVAAPTLRPRICKVALQPRPTQGERILIPLAAQQHQQALIPMLFPGRPCRREIIPTPFPEP